MRKFLSLALAVVMVLSLAIPAFAANELSAEAQFLMDNGIMVGDQGDFMPEGQFTNEQLMTVLSRITGNEAVAQNFPMASTFVDVPAAHWAAKTIGWAQANNYALGDGAGVFGLGEQVNGTRLAIFMLRALGYQVDGNNPDYTWQNAYQAAVDKGIMATVGANDFANRELVAKVVYNTLNTTMKNDTAKLGYSVLGLEQFKTAEPYNVSLVAPVTQLRADGEAKTLVTFELRDENGQLITNAGKVEVAFTATFGNFGEQRVTVQNGVATVVYSSEFLVQDKKALLRGVIVEADNKDLINLRDEIEILLTPNPDAAVDEQMGARATAGEANQADRVTLFFNKPVNVASYVYPSTHATPGAIDPNKLGLTVWTKEVDPLNVVAVRGLMAVPGNDSALFLMLDVETAPANALTDNEAVVVEFIDRTGTVEVNSTINFKLTDTRKPALLAVDVLGLRTIRLTFSEAIDEASGENFANWRINGIDLNNAYWNFHIAGGTDVQVGAFNRATGVDNRHIVTITLGRYLTAGNYSVQASNIGDWAFLSDPINNVMNTQTLDFSVAADTSKPTATVEVQSPEQYKLVFNKTILQDITHINAALTANVQIQRQNPSTGAWVTIGTGIVAPGANPANQDLRVTAIPNQATSTYLVEVDKDWTVFENTLATNKNYYNFNYRLRIPANSVSNAANGLFNDEILLPLQDKMLFPDLTSPSIVQIDKVNNMAYNVTMSEPVKLGVVGNPEGATLAQTQTALPVPTAQFIKKGDYSVTVDATVMTTFVDRYDTVIRVIPAQTLANGDWMLVVRSISDDVGNTAASATAEFNVYTETVATDFRVAYAWADTQRFNQSFQVARPTGLDGDGGYDYVYVKFNKWIATSGDFRNALKTSNYTINGTALPTGTQIVANIQGFDHKNVNYHRADSITIILPQGYLTDKNAPHVINFSSFIESFEGEKLANPGERVLPWQAGIANVTNEATLITAVQDPTVRVINTTGAIALTDDLTIDRIVTLNLGGDLTAGANDLVIASNETGTVFVTGAFTIDEITINIPRADFTVAAGTTIGTLNVTAVSPWTLNVAGMVNTLNVAANTTVNLNLTGAGVINEINGSAKQEVTGTTIAVDLTPYVTTAGSLEVTFTSGTISEKVTVELTVSNVATTTTDVAAALDAELPAGLTAANVGNVLTITSTTARNMSISVKRIATP